MSNTSRRDFLKTSIAAAGAAGLGAASVGVAEASAASPGLAPPASDAASGPLPVKKGILVDMLPKGLSYTDRFKLARNVGFEALQVNTTPKPADALEIKRAAETAGMRIDSVMNMDHWKYPLSSADPKVVEKSLEGMRTSLHNANSWGARYVLLVPAVVNAEISYRDAWKRSQAQIRKLVPLAEQLKVVIALEEVWNKFLLSPLEFATYVDEFHSPWVKAWFDVGNVVLYGYPQDWIRTLGNRIVDMHVKDFKRRDDGYQWVNLGDGDVDWPEVRKALREIHYSGTVITELDGGDEAYLRDLSQRFDRLVIGKA
ncbi:MAG TPA: sugar phosphate isomerase/epimerase family protein [Terriglobia bacterium]|nr:sugar phosphate isomerase/epimerase family protein [Terriglobia bacterium]